jgi:hypothetical protein
VIENKLVLDELENKIVSTITRCSVDMVGKMNERRNEILIKNIRYAIAVPFFFWRK